MSGEAFPTATLKDWRQIFTGGGTPGILIGWIVAHPRPLRGWVLTSPLMMLSRTKQFAVTRNTRYLLQDEYRGDQDMTPGAHEVLKVHLERDTFMLLELKLGHLLRLNPVRLTLEFPDASTVLASELGPRAVT